MEKLKEKFSIEKRLKVGSRELYLLNKPFEKRMEEKDFHDEFTEKSKISAYHHSKRVKAEWMRYSSLRPCEILIVSSNKEYLTEEALIFIAENKGIGLSRDNLFMMWSLYRKDLIPRKGVLNLLGLMPEDVLPKHKAWDENKKMCPYLEVKIVDPWSNPDLNYAWWWVDEKLTPNYKFAFMRPI